jgi:hypothetical protein
MDKPATSPDLGTLRTLVARKMRELMSDRAYMQFFFDPDTLYDLGLTGDPEAPIHKATVIDRRDEREFRVSDLFEPAIWSLTPRNRREEVDLSLPDDTAGEPEPSLFEEGWMIRLSPHFWPQASRLTAFVTLNPDGSPQDVVDFELD